MNLAALSTLSAPLPRDRSIGRLMPAWGSASLIAASVCLSCWMVFGYVHRATAPLAVVARDQNSGDGVRRQGSEHWRITCGPATIIISQRQQHAAAILPIEGPLETEFYFERFEFLTPEQVQTLLQVKRLSQNRALEKQLGLSTANIREIEALRAGAALSIGDADAQRLRSLFRQYQNIETAEDQTEEEWKRQRNAAKATSAGPSAAPTEQELAELEGEVGRLDTERVGSETLLVQMTAQIADRLCGPTRASAIERSARAQSLLTPAQWKQLGSLPRR